jgi:hypothetical protein
MLFCVASWTSGRVRRFPFDDELWAMVPLSGGVSMGDGVVAAQRREGTLVALPLHREVARPPAGRIASGDVEFPRGFRFSRPQGLALVGGFSLSKWLKPPRFAPERASLR